MLDSFGCVPVWYSELNRSCPLVWHWSFKSLFESYTCVTVWNSEPSRTCLFVWHWSVKRLFNTYACVRIDFQIRWDCLVCLPVWHSEPRRSCPLVWHWLLKSLCPDWRLYLTSCVWINIVPDEVLKVRHLLHITIYTIEFII